MEQDEEVFKSIVLKNLYKNRSFDFEMIRKPLLIAISSLIKSGRTIGGISEIITLNFDSLLEWYLQITGVVVTTTFEQNQIIKSSEVEVIHPHGYLPHPNHQNVVSDYLVFSESEFDYFVMNEKNYFRSRMINFFSSKIFLSVGVGPGSLIDYTQKKFLNYVSKNYEGKERRYPFGFSIIPIDSYNKFMSKQNKTKDQLDEEFMKKGIVPVIMEKENIPQFLFAIAQKVAGVNVSYQL